MNPERFPDPVDSTQSPAPARPTLDPSEEEALFQHLRRYRAREGRRRPGRSILATGTVVAGAVLLVIVTVGPWARPAAPPPEIPAPAPPASGAPAPDTPHVEARVGPDAPRMDAPAAPAPRPIETPAERQPPEGAAPPVPPGARAEAADGPDAPRSEPPVARVASQPPAPAAPPSAVTTRGHAGPTVASSPPTPTPVRTSAREAATVRYQPRERLAAVSAGDPKERIFDRFATTFEERDGAVLRIDGMRWRANGRSPHHAHVEVADVVLADAGSGRVHWFLFGDGRLLAWGRPEEWPAAARRHDVETDYRPAATGARGAP